MGPSDPRHSDDLIITPPSFNIVERVGAWQWEILSDQCDTVFKMRWVASITTPNEILHMASQIAHKMLMVLNMLIVLTADSGHANPW